MMRVTLYKYLSREIWSVFFVSLLVLIFIIMTTRIMGITDLLVNQHVYPAQILKIILCLLPRVIIFSMPAACLMGVLLAFIRLSSDNEIVALHSSGISLYQMLPPVVSFSLACYIIAGLIAIYGVPWGNSSYRDVVFQIIKSKADLAVKERVFYEPFDNVVFYVNGYSQRDRIMKDLFVVDKRDEHATSTIVAKKGIILSDRGSNIITIHFMEGTIYTIEKNFETARTIKFETYDLNIDLTDIMSSIISREKKPNEMHILELINSLKSPSGDGEKTNLMGIKLFEMFSIPLAIFLLGIIGAPLGSHVKAKGNTMGIIISLLIFLAYHICLIGSKYICEKGIIAPSLGVWIPDLLLLIISIYLMARAANHRPMLLLRRFFSDGRPPRQFLF